MVLSEDGLVNLTNYTLFIAELMLAHKACRATTHVAYVYFMYTVHMFKCIGSFYLSLKPKSKTIP